MKILVTGGCGNMGGHVVRVFAREGHEVRVVDKDAEGLKKLAAPGVEILAGDISDKNLAVKAVQGVDAIIHLAWSFSEDLLDLIDIDVKGYKHLLDAAVEQGVQHVINASTAVAYGKPLTSPVDETHPHLVEKARKPPYALAKLITEELGKIYAEKHPVAVNNVMIWYAYGDEIGGKHIRGMVKDAIQKGCIEVPANSGGSFLQLDDFITGVKGILAAKPKGELFNLATVYLTWEELARLIVAQANPAAKVVAVPKEEWTGSSFLADDWHFSTRKAEQMLHFRTKLTREKAIAHLSKALEACVAEVKAKI
ncbi:MAG: NAD(P)-dependent oxidoreductase [Deltaproteobacteria bacterium]|nr:NAD(P)-dependent oxidoreductase [Deltaproteobacteria bacterium]